VSFRTAQILSKVFLWMAVFALVMFHRKPFLLADKGWMVWESLPMMVRSWRDWIFVSPFFLSLGVACMLIPGSPFVGKLWIQSKMAWGLCLATSGIVTLYLCYYQWDFCDVFEASFVEAFIRSPWFIVAPALNFAGLLFARAGARRQGAMIDSREDSQVGFPADGA